MKTKSHKQKDRRRISEPLYKITRAGSDVPLVVLGAPTKEIALLRAEFVRHLVQMPPAELLAAKRHEAGTVIQAAYFSASYFAWLEEILNESRQTDGGVCPLCGEIPSSL